MSARTAPASDTPRHGVSAAGSLSLDQVLAAARLPDELDTVVRTVAQGSRLWRSERADVARELVAHFADGLSSGKAPDALLAEFGDATRAARLIRRAKRRSRPRWYRALVWTGRGAGVLVLVVVIAYAYLAGRFFLLRPNIARNYAAEFNRAAMAAPAEQRAWPTYISAIRALGPDPAFLTRRNHGWPETPSDPEWENARAYLREHSEAVSLIRRAAAAPMLGVMYRSTIEDELGRALETRNPGYKHAGGQEVENPLLIGVLLPHLGEMRRFARLLRFDAADAARAGDRARFVADIEALLGIASHAWSEPMLISKLVGLAVADLTFETVRRHAAEPGLLESADYQRLAHRVGAFGGGRLRLSLEGERAMYEDFLQRFYSDDGSGDGSVVFAEMPGTMRDFGAPDPAEKTLVRAALPVVVARARSRAEAHRVIDRAIAAVQRDEMLPMWRRHERSCDVEWREVSGLVALVFRPLSSLVDSDTGFGAHLIARDAVEMNRDATLTVLALEAYRLREGRYPESLAELVPAMLPAAPVDGADGRPLRYRVTDGVPLLYSVGADGDDDGGRPPGSPSQARQFGPRVALGTSPQSAAANPEIPVDGDWVLYRVPEPRAFEP